MAELRKCDICGAVADQHKAYREWWSIEDRRLNKFVVGGRLADMCDACHEAFGKWVAKRRHNLEEASRG